MIALHALNNSIAYGYEAENAVVPLIFGPLMLAACIAGPRFFHARRTAAA